MSKTRLSACFISIVALLALSCALVGCGNGSSSTTGTSSSSSSSTSSSTSSGDADYTHDEYDESDYYTIDFADLGSTDGMFVVDAAQTEALQLWSQADPTSFDEFDGTDYRLEEMDYDENMSLDGGFLLGAAEDPFEIDASAGEQLAIVGNDGSGVRLFPADFIGYGNPDYSEEMASIDEIEGVDIDATHSFPEANEALEGTGLTFYPYVRSGGSNESILLADAEDQDVEFGNYSGSTFEENSCFMYAGYYTALKRDLIIPDVTSTKDGYFVIELDGVEPGTYLLYDKTTEDQWMVEIS